MLRGGEQTEFLDGCAGLFRRFVKQDLPATVFAGNDILLPIVKVKDFRPAFSGLTLHHLVKFRIGLHGAVFVGEDVAVEMVEKREIPADMTDRQVVRIGEDKSPEAVAAQIGVELDHEVNRDEDIGEESRELLEGPTKASSAANLLEKTVHAEFAAFEFKEQGGLIDERADLVGGQFAAGGQAAGSDAVVEIDEDLAEIKDNRRRGSHVWVETALLNSYRGGLQARG